MKRSDWGRRRREREEERENARETHNPKG